MPLVSVAVITYNMEQYLRQLLDSILEQEVDFEYEIVIDDDCSPDSSRDIIKEYQMRYPGIVKPAFRKKNVGGSRNMYGVLHRCKGKYIAILEGDDYWEDKNKLKYQVGFLENHPEYIGMTCNSWCDHGVDAEYKDVMRKRKEPKVFTFYDFLARHFHDRLPSSTDTWVFRNIFKLYPDKDYSLFYKAHPMVWDQSLILILYGMGNVYYDPKVVSHHRSISKIDGTNYQSKLLQKNYFYDDSRMYHHMERYIKDVLHKECGSFYFVRGDVWIDAFFRALLSKDSEDYKVSKLIAHNQKNKVMLAYLFMKKSYRIACNKMKKRMSENHC